MKSAKSVDSLPVVLSIAGSDSGGGAGIQADLRTFAALGVFGTSAITCITAQNPVEVRRVVPLAPDVIADQIRAVIDAFPVAAIKTGMLYSPEIVSTVAATIGRYSIPIIVVDPVMIASSGKRLMEEDALDALRSEILPMATVVTPNIPEAEALSNRTIRSIDDMKTAARTISDMFGAACVVTGSHLDSQLVLRSREVRRMDSAFPGRSEVRLEQGRVPRSEFDREVVDVLCLDGEAIELRRSRIPGDDVHGTGCAFSAAVTAFLARGESVSDAVAHAGDFVAGAIERSVLVGDHRALRSSPGSVV